MQQTATARFSVLSTQPQMSPNICVPQQQQKLSTFSPVCVDAKWVFRNAESETTSHAFSQDIPRSQHFQDRPGELTVAAVLVDLRVGLYLHRGSLGHLWHTALQGGADHQVVVLIDAFELLPDGQFLVARREGDLSLSSEFPTLTEKGGHEGGQDSCKHSWDQTNCVSSAVCLC